MMFTLKKIALFPISLFVAFLALMAKWLLTLSSYVVAPLMLYIFGCGIDTFVLLNQLIDCLQCFLHRQIINLCIHKFHSCHLLTLITDRFSPEP